MPPLRPAGCCTGVLHALAGFVVETHLGVFGIVLVARHDGGDGAGQQGRHAQADDDGAPLGALLPRCCLLLLLLPVPGERVQHGAWRCALQEVGAQLRRLGLPGRVLRLRRSWG